MLGSLYRYTLTIVSDMFCMWRLGIYNILLRFYLKAFYLRKQFCGYKHFKKNIVQYFHPKRSKYLHCTLSQCTSNFYSI
jgi:hypothetical protein